jgi:two-component system cell cycle response regulator
MPDQATPLTERELRSLVAQAHHNQQVMERLRAYERDLLRAGTLSELLHLLVAQARTHFDLHATHFTCSSHELRQLIPPDLPPELSAALSFDDSATTGPQAHTNPQLISDQQTLRTLPFGQPMGSALMLPLWADDQLLGKVFWGSRSAERFNESLAIDFLDHMSMIASLCLQGSVTREQMRRQGLTDALTALPNRRCLSEDLLREVSQAQRHGWPLSCLFIDADHFKRINDEHGHQAGDEVLRHLAQAIKSMVRRGDRPARYGGEEFVVLMPDCDGAHACLIAERLRRQVESLRIPLGNEELRITVSIGIASCDGRSQNQRPASSVGEALINAADQAVYAAKQSGRNCLRSAAGKTIL